MLQGEKGTTDADLKVEEGEPSGSDEAASSKSRSPDGKMVIEKLKTKLNEELSCTICNEIFIYVRELLTHATVVI